MGIMKEKVDEEKVDEGNYEYLPKVPQHIIDEEKVDRALERMREQHQMDMYNSLDWNWSGLM